VPEHLIITDKKGLVMAGAIANFKKRRQAVQAKSNQAGVEHDDTPAPVNEALALLAYLLGCDESQAIDKAREAVKEKARFIEVNIDLAAGEDKTVIAEVTTDDGGNITDIKTELADGADSVTDAADSVIQAADSVSQATASVESAANDVSDSASDISDASHEVSNSAASIADATADIAAAADEMKEVVSEVKKSPAEPSSSPSKSETKPEKSSKK